MDDQRPWLALTAALLLGTLLYQHWLRAPPSREADDAEDGDRGPERPSSEAKLEVTLVEVLSLLADVLTSPGHHRKPPGTDLRDLESRMWSDGRPCHPRNHGDLQGVYTGVSHGVSRCFFYAARSRRSVGVARIKNYR